MKATKEERNLDKEEKKQKINTFLVHYFKWLVIFVVVLVLGSGYFFLIRPKHEKIVQLTEVSNKERELDYLERERELGELSNLIKIYKNINPADIRKVNLILPEKDVEEELFTQLENLVSKNGLILTSLRIIPEPKRKKGSPPGSAQLEKEAEEKEKLPEEIGKIKVALNIIGADYNSFKNILSVLENNLRIIDIVDLSYSPFDSSLSLEFNTYYLRI